MEIENRKKNGERKHLDGEGKERLKTTLAEKSEEERKQKTNIEARRTERRKTLKHRKRERKEETLWGLILQ